MMHYVATIGNAVRTETQELLPDSVPISSILLSFSLSLSLSLSLSFSLSLFAIIMTMECASTWLIVNSSLKLIAGSVARIWAEEWRMARMPGECRLFKHRDLFIDFFDVLSFKFAVEFTWTVIAFRLSRHNIFAFAIHEMISMKLIAWISERTYNAAFSASICKLGGKQKNRKGNFYRFYWNPEFRHRPGFHRANEH